MILPTLARLALSTARLPAPRMMSTFGASTPFILLARAHVKPEFAKEHMEAAAVETKEKFNAVGKAVGFPIKYYDTTRVGYTRL